MDGVDNILIFPTCVINRVEIEEDMFLVHLNNSDNIISLKKTEENFRKITFQIQRQYDKNFKNEIIRIFDDAFSNNKSSVNKPLSLRYVLIGLKHYKALQFADFANIHETDLVSTKVIYKDRKLCKSLKKRYYELKKNI